MRCLCFLWTPSASPAHPGIMKSGLNNSVCQLHQPRALHTAHHITAPSPLLKDTSSWSSCLLTMLSLTLHLSFPPDTAVITLLPSFCQVIWICLFSWLRNGMWNNTAKQETQNLRSCSQGSLPARQPRQISPIWASVSWSVKVPDCRERPVYGQWGWMSWRSLQCWWRLGLLHRCSGILTWAGSEVLTCSSLFCLETHKARPQEPHLSHKAATDLRWGNPQESFFGNCKAPCSTVSTESTSLLYTLASELGLWPSTGPSRFGLNVT